RRPRPEEADQGDGREGRAVDGGRQGVDVVAGDNVDVTALTGRPDGDGGQLPQRGPVAGGELFPALDDEPVAAGQNGELLEGVRRAQLLDAQGVSQTMAGVWP